MSERQETKEWIRKIVSEYILETYGFYTRARDRAREGGYTPPREPSLTVAYLRDLLDQAGGRTGYWKISLKRQQSDMVRSVVEAMVKAGELGVAYGPGQRGGDVRSYHPKGQ